MTSKPKAHVSEKKKDIVKELVNNFKKNNIVGLVNIENLPASQFQSIKSKLRGKVDFFMTKKNLMKLAIEKVKAEKPNIEVLAQKLQGMPMLLFTKENPFSVFKIIKQNKSSTFAKAGQKSPKDIIVNAGPTQFTPGPIISEFGAIGVKAGVEAGKIVIKEDKLLCPEDSIITQAQANMLQKLGIQPMEIGLDVVTIYENGIFYDKKVLDVDEKKLLSDITTLYQQAMNLSVETGYFTKENIELFLQKAFRQVKTLALEADITTKEIIGELLAKAEAQTQALQQITK